MGAVALPDFCPRCFWVKRNAKLPYQIFPGIFSSIDAYTKHAVHAWFDEHGAPPPWLGLPDVVAYKDPPHHSVFRHHDAETDVLLTGSPDGVFVRGDGGHVIVDYKTAKFTKNADALFPMYEAQLNGYAVIGETFGFRPVDDLALLYMEPVTDEATARRPDLRSPDGFRMAFTAHVLPVRKDEDVVRALLRRVRAILDEPRAPPRRDGCRECEKADGLAAALGYTRTLTPTPAGPAPAAPARPPEAPE